MWLFELFLLDCSNRIFHLKQSYTRGQINDIELRDSVWKYLFQGKLTYLYGNKGDQMAPVMGGLGGTLLVRKLPAADPK